MIAGLDWPLEHGGVVEVSKPASKIAMVDLKARLLPKRSRCPARIRYHPAGEVPQIAGRFLEPQEFGRGGMGCIEAARDPAIGRRVAIKTLRAEYRDDERAVLRFVEEARTTGQLEHPNVVPIYDLGDEAADPFIVMRLIQGKTLAQVLESSKPVTNALAAELLQRLVQIILRICDALAFAHSRGVFHCDVKPDNIMVGEHGQVYLMDWGVAVTAQPREGFGGTVAYMAPEQLLGRAEDIDARTDIFVLGGVLYEVLTGDAPNDPRAMLAAALGVKARTFSPRALWTHLPPELCRIAAKAPSPVRDDRYLTVDALRVDLEQFLKGGGWFETLAAKAGETIVSEGEPGSTAYIIQSGACDVWKLFHREGSCAGSGRAMCSARRRSLRAACEPRRSSPSTTSRSE